jgi:hypothetical protein
MKKYKVFVPLYRLPVSEHKEWCNRHPGNYPPDTEYKTHIKLEVEAASEIQAKIIALKLLDICSEKEAAGYKNQLDLFGDELGKWEDYHVVLSNYKYKLLLYEMIARTEHPEKDSKNTQLYLFDCD